MINKPYSLLPSDLEDGKGVIDISQETTFSFQVTGTSPIYKMGIQICNLDGTTSSWLMDPVPANPIYYTDLNGNAKVISMKFSSTQLNSKVGNKADQKWRVGVWTSNTTNPDSCSDWVFVQLKTTPSANISISEETGETKYGQFTLGYTPSVTYESRTPTSNQTSVRSIRWQVFDSSDPTIALYDTGEVFGCVDPSYTVDGLMSGHSYFAVATIEDQDGVVTTATSANVTVSYDPGQGGLIGLVYTDEINAVTGDLVHGREIALDISRFSGPPGQSSGGDGGYDIENLGAPIGYVLENHSGNTIAYDDIEFDSTPDADNLYTVRMLFTPHPYLSGMDIASVYFCDDHTARVRYTITGDDGLVPSNTLEPSSTLVPSDRHHSVAAIYERMVNGSWEHVDSIVTPIASDEGFFYYEDTFGWTAAFEDGVFPEIVPSSDNLFIEIYGCDGAKLSYIVVDHNDTSYADDEDKQYNPPITEDTTFAVYFNNLLYAVNLQTGASPERITFYRYQDDENLQFKVAQLELGGGQLPSYIIDLSAANDESYKYVMYPEDSNEVYAGRYGERPDSQIRTIDGYVASEMLITSRWVDDYNAYVADRVFYFDFNNQLQPINNNAVVQKNQTFGRFFHIQHGATNVLSGTISGLIGYVDCQTMEFVSLFETEDAIRWLTTDDTTKFYKSARGYVLPVDITSAITFTPEKGRRASNVSFEWTEIKLPHPSTVIGVINS